MIVAFDVQYHEDYALAVAVCFHQWTDEKPFRILEKKLLEIAAYEPGQFYKRELPCIIALLEELDLAHVTKLVVDGYVYISDEGKPGLGTHLYEHLKGEIPVIGVAKTSFHQNKKHVQEVLRGESSKPLFVSAIGLENAEHAGDWIRSMHGDYRMPTVLQILDAHTKEKETKTHSGAT